MGNKTNVIQRIYDRASRLTNYGVKEVRIGSVETSRKHTDLPIVWVGLESGRESGNFQNAASVDTMRISLSILDNKLKLTSNTLFRVPENGGGDIYTISDEISLSIEDDILAWFGSLQTNEITTSDGINGANILSSGSSDSATSMSLSLGASEDQNLQFLEFIYQLQSREFEIGDSVVTVLCNTNGLPGFDYNGVDLGAAASISFEGGILSILPNIKSHTLTITDAWGNAKTSLTIYTYNEGAPIDGGSVKIGKEGFGALVLLEKLLDEIDLNSSGNRDITLGGAANNRRDIDYTVDSSGDYVLIQTFIDVESSIFINGKRSG